MLLSQSNVVIVGGASGMGAATARYLYEKNKQIKVAVLDLRESEDLSEEVGAISIVCDVTDEKSSQKAIDAVVEKWGSITVCVNCAGVVSASRIVGREGICSLAEFRRVIDINLVGTFNLLRLCAAQMLKQEKLNEDGERGVIINTASIAAYEGQVGQAAYSASKGGVVALTLPAARELGKRGVRVMTVAPGVIDTPMIESISDETRVQLEKGIPFPSRLGEATEYARLVVEIIENPYLNGSVIRLDGGLRMG